MCHIVNTLVILLLNIKTGVSMGTTNIRFTKELLEQIDKKAKDLGINRSAFIRMVLTKAVKEEVK